MVAINTKEIYRFEVRRLKRFLCKVGSAWLCSQRRQEKYFIHDLSDYKFMKCSELNFQWKNVFLRALGFSYSQYSASRSFLSVLPFVFSWSFHGCLICCLRQLWKYYEKYSRRKDAGELFSQGIVSLVLPWPLYFPPVTSCPQRPIFNWLTDQTIKLLSMSVSM